MLSLKKPQSFLLEALLRVPPPQSKGQQTNWYCFKNTVQRIRCTIKGSAFSIKRSTKHELSLQQKHCKMLHYNHQTKL